MESLGWFEFFKGKTHAIWGNESFARGMLSSVGADEEIVQWVISVRAALQHIAKDDARYMEECERIKLEIAYKTGFTAEAIRYFAGEHILVVPSQHSKLPYVLKHVKGGA